MLNKLFFFMLGWHVNLYVGWHVNFMWITFFYVMLDDLLNLYTYDFQLCRFFFSCNKNFDQPFWVPSAGQKCLTIKSSGIVLHDNDDMVSSINIRFSFEMRH
jgi:hypothetical protein